MFSISPSKRHVDGFIFRLRTLLYSADDDVMNSLMQTLIAGKTDMRKGTGINSNNAAGNNNSMAASKFLPWPQSGSSQCHRLFGTP